MDYAEKVKHLLTARAAANTMARDVTLPHASEFGKCYRNNILNWLRIHARRRTPLGCKITEELRCALEGEPTTSGVMESGQVYDAFLKDLLQRDSDMLECEDGTFWKCDLAPTGEPGDDGEIYSIGGTPDKVISWRDSDGKINIDIIDFKSTRNIYYIRKGGAKHMNKGQVSIYWNAFMNSLTAEDKEKVIVTAVLYYFTRDDIFNGISIRLGESDLIQPNLLRRYYRPLIETRNKIEALESIDTLALPPRAPMESWECKWKTGQCSHHDICY